MDPSELVASYQQEAAAVAERAEAAKAQVRMVQASVTSPDGAVTVTVNATGALQNVSFGARAEQVSRGQLASLVMQTARRAQAQAAQQVTAALAPVIGENSAAMDYLRRQLPDVEESTGDEPQQAPPTSRSGAWGAINDEARDSYQAPRPPAGPARGRRPQRPADDDDFPDSFMTRGGR